MREDGPLTRLRRGHEQLVLDLLRRNEAMSRAALAEAAGLSRTTLHDIVAALIGNGSVVTAKQGTGPRGRGRPAETLTLNPDAGEVIGIDFARQAVHVAIVNVAHEVVGERTETHEPGIDRITRVQIAERLVAEIAGPALELGSLAAVGVGVVGPVDESPHAELDALTEALRAKFGVDVLLDNNTRLAALAESIWGAAAGEQDVLYLRLSHGVGGGLVVGGALHRGAHGLSGEFGHITVEPDGKPCGCGGTGCLETVSSVPAVLEACAAEDLSALRRALDAHEPTTRAVFDEVGTKVGEVLAALCNAVGPSVVVCGGELADAGAALFDPVERALDRHLMPASRDRVRLHRGSLGVLGGALGGIALVLHESPLLSHYPVKENR